MCPLYTFRCESCGQEMWDVRKVDDRDNPVEEKCAKCGAIKWIRIQCASAVKFVRGNSWNYRKGDKN